MEELINENLGYDPEAEDELMDVVPEGEPEEPITISVGDVFICDKHYPERAKFSNDNGYIIKAIETNEEGEQLYQICEKGEPTAEEKAISDAIILDAERLPAIESAICDLAELVAELENKISKLKE